MMNAIEVGISEKTAVKTRLGRTVLLGLFVATSAAMIGGFMASMLIGGGEGGGGGQNPTPAAAWNVQDILSSGAKIHYIYDLKLYAGAETLLGSYVNGVYVDGAVAQQPLPLSIVIRGGHEAYTVKVTTDDGILHFICIPAYGTPAQNNYASYPPHTFYIDSAGNTYWDSTRIKKANLGPCVTGPMNGSVSVSPQTIHPGDEVTVTLSIAQPPIPVDTFWGQFTGFTPDVIGPTGGPPLATPLPQGTLTQNWIAVTGHVNEGVNYVGVTISDLVNTPGTFLKFKVRTLTTAPLGQQLVNVRPRGNNYEEFGAIFPEVTYVAPATYTIVAAEQTLTAATVPTPLTATLSASKQTIAPGDEFDLSLTISQPVSPIGGFTGLVTGLTSAIIDTNRNTSPVQLVTTGTLIENGWSTEYNFCPGPTCAARWDPAHDGSGMVIIAATGASDVTTAGTFLKVKVKTLETATPGTYSFGLNPVNGELFINTDLSLVDPLTIVPASVTITKPATPKKPAQQNTTE